MGSAQFWRISDLAREKTTSCGRRFPPFLPLTLSCPCPSLSSQPIYWRKCFLKNPASHVSFSSFSSFSILTALLYLVACLSRRGSLFFQWGRSRSRPSRRSSLSVCSRFPFLRHLLLPCLNFAARLARSESGFFPSTRCRKTCWRVQEHNRQVSRSCSCKFLPIVVFSFQFYYPIAVPAMSMLNQGMSINRVKIHILGFLVFH